MMKQRINLRQTLAGLLVLVMVLTVLPLQALAARGDLVDGVTGVKPGSFNTGDTINLPIEIYDYPADGMLFEYSSQPHKDQPDANWWRSAFWGWGNNFAHMPHPNTSPWYANRTNGNTTVDLVENTSVSGCHYLKATWNHNRNGHDVPASLGHAFWYSDSFGDETGTGGKWSYTNLDDIRYIVMVYRTNVQTGSMMWTLGREDRNGDHRWSTPENRSQEFPFTQGGATGEGTETRWTYQVFDMKTGGLGQTWTADYGQAHRVYMATPMTQRGQWMDVSAITYFRTEKDAIQFGEYAISGDTARGANLDFGLLLPGKNQDGTTIPGRTPVSAQCGSVIEAKARNPVEDKNLINLANHSTIGYDLYGKLGANSYVTMGLLESGLSENGLPQYKAEVVDYLAGLLHKTLNLPENPNGWTNYMDPRGLAQERFGGVDLPTALTRLGLTNNGSASAAAGRNLIGTWEDCKGSIKTYHDAAYFLLNNIFVRNSYNVPQNDYDHLALTRAIAANGTPVYVFDGGFGDEHKNSAVAYGDTARPRTIRNTSAATKPLFQYGSGSATTTLYPFLPVTSGNNEQGHTITPYVYEDAALSRTTEQDTYRNRDYNYVLKSSGEFVYHAEENQFFHFEGDDDVYLFINGELVLDLGGAHSIATEGILLNNFVNKAWEDVRSGHPTERDKKLALVEGNTYSFDFFYMERHGYGANMRIMTNIHVTDPKMTTTKSAYQDGHEIDYGSIVDQDKPIEYSFRLINRGNTNLYDLTFDDRDIGVKLDPVNGLTVTGGTVCDPQGGTLDAADLVAIVEGSDNGVPLDPIEVRFADNEALKAFLVDLTSAKTQGGTRAGLWPQCAVTFRGIGYKMTQAQIDAAVFENTVHTSARSNETILHGSDTHRVFVPSDPMYYQWAGHDLVISKEKLVEDVLVAATNTDNTLHDKIPGLNAGNVTSMQLTTAAGYAINNPDVVVTNDSVTVSYPRAGSRVFYVKLSYGTDQTVIVPVLVNSTAVKDSFFVLDYGLDAELTQNGALYRDDTLTVPGRKTDFRLEGISGELPGYQPNHITFTAQEKVTGTFGSFLPGQDTLTYSLAGFLEGEDSAWVALRVGETDFTSSNPIGTVDINNEVEMYKAVTVLPANVVYYEDDFPAIKYHTTGQNTLTPTGRSIGKKQEVDQDQEYGQDEAYQINQEMSGGSLHTVTFKEKQDCAVSFKFTGTGFELIARTNATDSASLIVAVKDSTGAIVKRLPVITEFDNGGDGGSEVIYQVPVMRVDDLARQTYTVEISGVPSRDGTPTKLYLDGIRIFQPIDPGNEHYNENEKNARFLEIRDQILSGVAAVTKYQGSDLSYSTGTTTWVENRNGDYQSNLAGSADGYLLAGPNNEVYMNGALDDSALVFYVRETDSTAHSLQVAMRGIDKGLFYGSGSTGVATPVYYGAHRDGQFVWVPLVTLDSSTEQYYSIPYRDCYQDAQGRYQIVIKADAVTDAGHTGASSMISFSSFKLTGLELSTLNGETASMHYENGVLVNNETNQPVDPAAVMNFEALSAQMRSTALVPGDSEVPESTDPVDPDPTDPDPAPTDPDPDPTDPTEPEDPEPDEDDGNDHGKRIREFLKKLFERIFHRHRP